MSTETLASKPSVIVKAVLCETKPPAATGAAAEVAAHSNAEGLQLPLKELASPDSARRAAAAEALGRMADVAAAPALIAALGDADANVARQAAASLGLLGSAAAVEPLIAVLNNRDGFFHNVARIAAAGSLGQLNDPAAVVPLLNAIRDPIADVSAQAIGALASLADPRSITAFLEVIRNEHDFFLATTRRAAILGLARIGGKQAACELRFVAGNEWENPDVRAAAIEAMRPTGDAHLTSLAEGRHVGAA